MSVLKSFLTCVVRGHRWDVAPALQRSRDLECVRCGLRAGSDSDLA